MGVNNIIISKRLHLHSRLFPVFSFFLAQIRLYIFDIPKQLFMSPIKLGKLCRKQKYNFLIELPRGFNFAVKPQAHHHFLVSIKSSG